MGQEVGTRRITKDSYERNVAELLIGEKIVQQEMVSSGHTEIYWRYAYKCPWMEKQ